MKKTTEMPVCEQEEKEGTNVLIDTADAFRFPPSPEGARGVVYYPEICIRTKGNPTSPFGCKV